MAGITELAYEAVLAENKRLTEALGKSNGEAKLLAKLQRAESARKRADKKSAKALQVKRKKASDKKRKQRQALKDKLGGSEYKAHTKKLRHDERGRARLRKEAQLLEQAAPLSREEECEALVISMGL